MCGVTLQIRQLFAFCGSVLACDFVGNENQFLLVEYATAKVWHRFVGIKPNMVSCPYCICCLHVGYP